MKINLLWVLFPFFAAAQSVDVNDVSTQESDSTTIEITKGKNDLKDKDWEVVEGAVPINGDPAPMSKAARRNWQKACNEWKKEFREDNKENRVISVSCGSPECSGPVGQKSCASTARFQVKTRITAD